MITAETRTQIRQWFFAEHWKIGAIAQALGIHPDTVRHAIESDRSHRAQTLRVACLTDPYLPFIRRILDQHPRPRATRIYQMIRDRGHQGSVIQLRRVVATLRPIRREPCGLGPGDNTRTVAEAFAEEQPGLLPLPAHPFNPDLILPIRS
jgi:hypothetical protein